MMNDGRRGWFSARGFLRGDLQRALPRAAGAPRRAEPRRRASALHDDCCHAASSQC
jgi:hypothetical protein